VGPLNLIPSVFLVLGKLAEGQQAKRSSSPSVMDFLKTSGILVEEKANWHYCY
jgi:hypothetical protein